jgi:hypothetical protein
MKVYKKKLNSVEELKREKMMLEFARKHSEAQKPFSIDEMLRKPDVAEGKAAGALGMASKLFASKSNMDMLTTLAGPLLGMVTGRVKKKVLGSGLIKKAVFEVFGGYAKWKLLQMGYRGIMLAVKAKKKGKKEKIKPVSGF